MQAAGLPRFLLPRAPWSGLRAPAVAFQAGVEARRHGSVWPGSDRRRRRIAPSSHAALQTQAIRRPWRAAELPQWAGRGDSCDYAVGRQFQRGFRTTARQAKDHHFDTLKFVQRLKEEGFTEEQAEGMMRVLSDVIEESIQNLTRTMVLREDQEKATYTQKVDFAKLRSELMTADSTESSVTRASHERLTNELAKLNSRLRDEIQRTQASVRLDLNLEKGRIREEANVQELKLKETDTRIEQETAQLRERLEAVKFSTLQWLMGVCTGTAALMLGVWRLLM
ncbi:uncharacterized protein SETTUDRAFT_143856 [Exserohilum turcica Et28A]|uniref:DUF1640-domain-containing protein n=1 Tax=Exserohilum turcicum (strain 28A) TaxID=671987 RepID=R0JX26_EXST2|nr:uncharacterized protein SETTUDRAFT_143856 [Exserohilum turcica Et28A]EOA80817.1 hypothetical protein SETTUDRAFT_143856 [Exserohilum turcica Et28A]